MSGTLVVDDANDATAVWDASDGRLGGNTGRGKRCVAAANAADADADGVPDVCDNCPHLQNAEQEDSDKDSIGNV